MYSICQYSINGLGQLFHYYCVNFKILLFNVGQGLLKGREAESPLWSRSEHEHRLRIKGNSGNPQEPPAGSMLAFLNIHLQSLSRRFLTFFTTRTCPWQSGEVYGFICRLHMHKAKYKITQQGNYFEIQLSNIKKKTTYICDKVIYVFSYSNYKKVPQQVELL